MDPSTLETYRQRLLLLQQQVVKRIFDIEEDLLQKLIREREIEFMDRGQAEVPEEVLNRLDEQSRREVEDIQAALARIKAGTYGHCETCGATISAARLEALPMVRRCRRCQERIERTARE
jgi:RNA polymerase-binding protein DksA